MGATSRKSGLVATAWLLLLLAAGSPLWAAGRLFVVYEVAQGMTEGADTDLHLQQMATDGRIGWADGPQARPLACTRSREYGAALCTDGAGGAYIAYMAQTSTPDNKSEVDVLVVRVDEGGKPRWTGPAAVNVGLPGVREENPVVVADGQGGVMVVFESTDTTGDTDVLAQRLSPEGKPLWVFGDRPQAYVACSQRPERNPSALLTSDGALLVAFEWVDEKGNADIMAQRLALSGRAQWNKGEQAMDVVASSAHERLPQLVSDGQGGALVVCERETRDSDGKVNVDILAQRICVEGRLRWNEGTPVAVAATPTVEQAFTAIADGDGGAVVAYLCPSLEGGGAQIAAQRLDREGKLRWNEGSAPAVVAAVKNRPLEVRGMADGSETVLLFAVEYTGGEHKGDVDIAAQRLDASGKALWSDGKPLRITKSFERELTPVVASDGEDGTVVVFAQETPTPGAQGAMNLDLMALRLAPNGDRLWHEGQAFTVVAESKTREAAARMIPVDY